MLLLTTEKCFALKFETRNPCPVESRLRRVRAAEFNRASTKQIQNLHPVESSEGGPPTGGIPQGRFSNIQKISIQRDSSSVSVIWILVIRICPSTWLRVVSPSTLLRTVSLSNGLSNHFGFRYSDFGFTLDMCHCGKSSIRLP